MQIRSLAYVAGLAVLVAGLSIGLHAQGARWEKTLVFKVDQSMPLDAELGPVKITNLKVINLGRGYGRGGFAPGAPRSELSTTLRFAFDGNNPSEDEWEVRFTIELLDKEGRLIDRFAGRDAWEEETKTYNLNHPILEYVLPAVSQMRVTMQGRLD